MTADLVYGLWARRTPAEAAEFMAGYPGTWWVAGGWALEAFTGVRRPHEDVDLSIFRSDLPLLRRHLAGKQHIWVAASGAIKPLADDDRPSATAEEVLPADCGNVWTRPNALWPWEYDVLLSPGMPGTWIYKRDESITLPLSEALFQVDGVNYLRPEIQLLYKAKGLRAKDQLDFAATVAHLDDQQRAWMRGMLRRTLPGHPWIEQL
jgi:hypothetical protein